MSYLVIDNIPNKLEMPKRTHSESANPESANPESALSVSDKLSTNDVTTKYDNNYELGYSFIEGFDNNNNDDNDNEVPILIMENKVSGYSVYTDVSNTLQKVEKPKLIDEEPSDLVENEIKSMNLITQIYLGSLTVVGLFVLFRFIQKSK